MAGRSKATGLNRIAVWGCAGLGAGLTLFAQTPSFWGAAAFLAPTGFALMALMASCNTMLQLSAPDEMRGRVMSLYTMLYMGMAPFGSLTAGLLAQWLGAPLAVTILGLCCFAGAVWAGRALWREAPPTSPPPSWPARRRSGP